MTSIVGRYDGIDRLAFDTDIDLPKTNEQTNSSIN